MIIGGLCKDSTSIVFSFLRINDIITTFGYDVQFVKNHPKFKVCHTNFKIACECCHRDLVELMIEKGANYWNQGLEGACRSGHRDIVDRTVEKGADDW